MAHQNYIKPFTHWVIYKQMKVRFTSRSPEAVHGVVTGANGEILFHYTPVTYTITLPMQKILINEYGWELEVHPIGEEAKH